MTEKEKAKAYDEALKKASAAHKDEDRHLKATLERIFPELKESDDKRIKKDLIQLFDEFPGTIWRGHYKKDIIAWLEKQGEQEELQVYETKDGKTITYSETDGYKFVEPKFKIGDWVVFIASESVYQVEKIEDYEYTLRHIFGGSLCLSFSHEELIREWTIEDAKDGDVLALGSLEDKNLWERIIIFKKYHSEGVKGLYSMPCVEGYGNTFKNGKRVLIEKAPYYSKTWPCNFHPATKEQRDALMKAMEDAGYDWDPEKKKIKVK